MNLNGNSQSRGNLANCQEFIDDYERDNNLRVNLVCENMSPSERAVRELIEEP